MTSFPLIDLIALTWFLCCLFAASMGLDFIYFFGWIISNGLLLAIAICCLGWWWSIVWRFLFLWFDWPLSMGKKKRKKEGEKKRKGKRREITDPIRDSDTTTTYLLLTAYYFPTYLHTYTFFTIFDISLLLFLWRFYLYIDLVLYHYYLLLFLLHWILSLLIEGFYYLLSA